MSRRQEIEPVVRKHLVIYERDWDRLEQYFGGLNNIGVSMAVRKMIRANLDKLDAKVEETTNV